MALLHPGDKFPALTVALPGGGSLQLPDALSGQFGVVLFYRGSWCPYCNAQLRAFQRARDGLAGVGAEVVALSVDDEATTADLIARLGLEFPVGHSARALRPGPRRAGRRQRLLQRRHRAAGARGRHRPPPLPPRARCLNRRAGSRAPPLRDARRAGAQCGDNGHAAAAVPRRSGSSSCWWRLTCSGRWLMPPAWPPS